MFTKNTILMCDSYKSSHWLQYPENTTKVYSYIESRGGAYSSTVFFGLQPILEQLEKPITVEMVEEAKEFYGVHGVPFNYDGWLYIAKDLNGKLPVQIKAVAEGVIVPTRNVLVTVENTDPKCYWLTSYLETMLLRVWYPITVSTQSKNIKNIIMGFLNRSSDDPASEIDFKLHDFGARGVSSGESAAMGGAAHLVNFKGSDTIEGVWLANKCYQSEMSAFSLPAAEHSTITSWGRDKELDAYRNMLKQFAKPNALLAVVSDSYDLFNAIENMWGTELKKEVVDSGAVVVIRPDSGDPVSVCLKAAQLIEEKFGCSYNTKGYKVFNNVRLIQGDGVNEESIRKILETFLQNGYSATNIAFGMGGALLQQVNRDTLKFAMKCSNVTVDGKDRDVFKDPITDSGKKSKKGRLSLTYLGGEFKTVEGGEYEFGNVLKTVFENGVITKRYTLDEVRRNSNLTHK